MQSIIAYIHINHLNEPKSGGEAISAKNEFKLLKSKYKNGDKLVATILYINPYSKVVYLTQLKHLLNDNKLSKLEELLFENKISIGSFLSNENKTIKIIKYSAKGLFVKFKHESVKGDFIGFISKRELMDKDELEEMLKKDSTNEKKKKKTDDDDDEDIDEVNDDNNLKDHELLNQFYWKHITKEFLEKHYQLDKSINADKARVIDYNLIDNFVVLSILKEKLNENTYLNYNDENLKCGKLIKCKIRSFNSNNGGLQCKLSDTLHAFIPKIHTADIPLKDPLAKMPIDSEIKCKVLSINQNDKKLILTAKKTIIKMKPSEELTKIDDNLKQNFITYGVVLAIKEYGLLIGFFNDVKALMPLKEITSLSLKKEKLNKNEVLNELNKLFYLGQLIKCRVIDINIDKQQLKVSQNLEYKKTDNKMQVDDDSDVDENKQISINNKFIKSKFYIGDLIEANLQTNVTIEMKNLNKNYFLLKIQSVNTNNYEFAVINKYHLSDNTLLNECLFKLFDTKFNFNLINNQQLLLLVLHDKYNQNELKSNNYRNYLLTCKKSLINVYTHDIENEESRRDDDDDDKEGKYYTGWICKKQVNGILVELVVNNNKKPSSLSTINTGCIAYCANKSLKKQNINLNELNLGDTVICKLNEDKKLNNLNLIKQIKTINQLNFGNQLKYNHELELKFNYLYSTLNTFNFMLKTDCIKQYKAVKSSDDIASNTLNWLKQLSLNDNLKIMSVINVEIKTINHQTNRIDCVYVVSNGNEGELGQDIIIKAYAYVNINEQLDTSEIYSVGKKLNAIIISYDINEMSLCLTIDTSELNMLKKHQQQLNIHKNLDILKLNQTIKGEIIGLTREYCIVALKQHAIGRIAYMPIYTNDELQSKNNEDINKLVKLEKKINKKNLKNNKKPFNYYSIGQIGKFKLKLVKNDFILCKLETKLKQKATTAAAAAVLVNKSTQEHEVKKATKRKLKTADACDTIEIVGKKKAVAVDDDSEEATKQAKIAKTIVVQTEINETHSIGDRIDYPWEITSFDQFYEILNEKTTVKNASNETLNGNDIDDESKRNGELKLPSRKKQKLEKSIEEVDKEILTNEEKLFDRQLNAQNAQSSDDYERLLISQPNSSLMWIKYIVFYLQSADVDKARQVCERALKTIMYREEEERLNVWVAYLNLECMYGANDKLDEVFQRATQNCDSFKVHQHLAEIYARSNKIEVCVFGFL